MPSLRRWSIAGMCWACTFSRYGMAPEYLKIDGAWQDHLMYQRILF